MRIPWMLLLAGLALAAPLDAPAEGPKTKRASEDERRAAQIADLARELGSPLYERREKAMDRLKEYGAEAVEPVERACLAGELEVAIRGIAILERLAIDDDAHVADVAAQALERMKNSTNPSVAWRAKRALTYVKHWAYHAIESLGGHVSVHGDGDEDSVVQLKLDGVPGRRLTPFQQRALKRFPVLVVAGGNVADDDIAFLANLTDLQHLDLRYTKVGDAGVAHLQNLKQLRKLMLSGTQVGDVGLGVVAGLSKLEVLYLSSTKISDTGLAQVSRLSRLREVNLSQCKGVGDDAMKHLSRAASLKEINLTGTKVGDAGLETLAGMPQLEQLHLHGTQVSDEGVARLQKSLPKCRIKH